MTDKPWSWGWTFLLAIALWVLVTLAAMELVKAVAALSEAWA